MVYFVFYTHYFTYVTQYFTHLLACTALESTLGWLTRDRRSERATSFSSSQSPALAADDVDARVSKNACKKSNPIRGN